MDDPSTLQLSTNLNCTSKSWWSSLSPPLPMSTEVNEITPCPPLSYCPGSPQAKDELINKAATRLRRRSLQRGIMDAKTKLDDLRIELSTTESVLSKFDDPDDRQLLALEQRFNTHQLQLDLIMSACSTSKPEQQSQLKPQLQENAITASTSFSSTLSRIDSSVANDTCSTSEYGNQNDAQYTLSDLDAREKRMRRRRRVKQLRQEYQQRLQTYSPTWNTIDSNDRRLAPSKDSDKNISDESMTVLSIPAPNTESEQQKQVKQQQHHVTTNTTGKKRPLSKQTVSAMKKPMMTSTKPIQSKPAAAMCLCKRKTTSKADPVKHLDKAPSSSPSPTYHSNRPEMVLLETQKPPLSPSSQPLSSPSPPTAAKDETASTTPLLNTGVLALRPPSTLLSNDDEPPRPSHVSDWILEQRQYHLHQRQQQHDDDNDEDDTSINGEEEEGAWMKKETSIDSHQLNVTMDTGSNYDHTILKPSPPRMGFGTQTKHQLDQQSTSLLDDVLRYLDTMSDFGNDSGLQQDISHLLAPMGDFAPSICSSFSSSSSVSSSWSTSSLLTNHGTVGKYCSRYLVDGVNKSLSWCKFISVLSLALLISLGRGPDHMLLSLDDLDYLDLMAHQGDPLVSSYYL
ncbi:hypothetical protein BCR42DRAFT_408144 [Absidia repens]|uniref:Uncharacterized protein n=1 Tax=Absidia repens TaxID=90262 RepID=A0A1X2IT24_9FUNG|nr:hypothetical protein BCR42DRAFT_408144 [Absidia repens]